MKKIKREVTFGIILQLLKAIEFSHIQINNQDQFYIKQDGLSLLKKYTFLMYYLTFWLPHSINFKVARYHVHHV